MFNYDMDELTLTRDGKEYTVNVEYNYNYGEEPSWTCAGDDEGVDDLMVFFHGFNITSTITPAEEVSLIKQIMGRH